MDAQLSPIIRHRNRPGQFCLLPLILACAMTLLWNSEALGARRGATANQSSSSSQPTATSSTPPTTAPTPVANPSPPETQSPTASKSSAPKSSSAKNGVPKPASATTSDAPILSADAIAAHIKDLEATTDAVQPKRAALLDLYRQALDDLKQTDDQKTHTAELEKQRIAAPYQLEILRRANNFKPVAKAITPATLPAGAPLDTWEQMLATAQQELEAAEKVADESEAEQQRREARRLEIPQTIAADRIKLDDLEKSSPDSSHQADDTADVVQARSVARQARKLALQTEIALAEKELQTYDNVAAELLSLQRDAAAKSAEEIKTRVTAWRDAVDNRRQVEADQQASEARLAAVTAVPAIRQLADDNSDLASRRQQLTKSIKQLAAERESVAAHLDKVSDQFKQATDKLTATGLTEAIGQLLLKERSELLAIAADRHAVQLRQQEISRVQLELFEAQEQLADLRNLDARVAELRAAVPKDQEAKPEDLRRLLQTKRKYLEALVDDDNLYFAGLVEIDSNQRELINQADSFRDFIDQRVLWVRSTHPLSFGDATKVLGAIGWSLRPANWWSALSELADAIRTNSAWCLLAGLVFVPWVFAQRKLKAIIQNDQKTPLADGTSEQPTFRRTCYAAGATILVSAVWPALAWFIGSLLIGGSAGHGEFPEALGAALQTTAGILLPLLLVRQICRHDGLAETHFGWPRDILLPLRRQLTWLALAGAPALLFVMLLESQSTEAWKDSLGRLSFIAGELLVAGFVFVVLRPPHGPLHRLMVLRSDSWTSQLSLPTFLVMVALPLALAGLATCGYFYTALRLATRLQITVWLVLGLVLAQALTSIWLTGVYRRLAMKSALRRTASPKRLAGTPQPAVAPAPEIDVEKVDSQTQGLLHNLVVLALAVGLCLIWVEMFPALRFFNQITVWGDAGSLPITLGNLLEALVVATLTIIAAKNIPSLLEVAVLQYMMPERGARYALVAVIRYAIIVVGIAAAGATVGIGWSKLQWLIAAMSFGLGFGLQEIFANFVSGMIVLFERPIRIGDTVTVGDVTGVVSRIRIRATTIIDADRKELILPNKDLISGRLVNWTLTDSVVRLVIRLGIAYGSDTAQAQSLLLQVASTTPEVLKTPSPKAVFMGFGEKSLDFELRVFVSNVEAMLPVRHQLNMAIDRTFHAAGVEIAFAQADTYVRNAIGSQGHGPMDGMENSHPPSSSVEAAQKAA